MRFRVTGGADGVSGIDVGSKRYEPGDEIDLTGKQAEWLIEQGYLEPIEGSKKFAKTVEVEPTPVVEEPVVEAGNVEASADAGSEF